MRLCQGAQFLIPVGLESVGHEPIRRVNLHVATSREIRLIARSLDVLRFARECRPEAIVKSGLMVGFGESGAEVEQVLADLRQTGVDVATIGQYLRPTRRNLPVEEFVAPAQFDAYRAAGERLGFKMVFSGPLVRSSYMADDVCARVEKR